MDNKAPWENRPSSSGLTWLLLARSSMTTISRLPALPSSSTAPAPAVQSRLVQHRKTTRCGTMADDRKPDAQLSDADKVGHSLHVFAKTTNRLDSLEAACQAWYAFSCSNLIRIYFATAAKAVRAIVRS